MSDRLSILLLTTYLLGSIVTFGHYVSRSDDCGTGTSCQIHRVMNGVFFVAPAWPLYWSIKAWER